MREANQDDRVLEAAIARCLSGLLAMAGRFDEAREYGRRSDPVLEEANMLTSSRITQNIAAYTKELAGDLDGAIRDTEAIWRAFRDTLGGAPDRRGMAAAYELANLYCDAGRWADAEECHAFYRDAPDPTAVMTTASRLAGAGRLAARRGEFAEAEQLARRSVDVPMGSERPNEFARVWLALAEVQRAAGDDAGADGALASAIELWEQKGNVAAAAALRAAAPV